MSYTSLIRISLDNAPTGLYPEIDSLLITNGPFQKTGTNLYSVTSGNEYNVLDAVEEAIKKLKSKHNHLDYINITIAKDD